MNRARGIVFGCLAATAALTYAFVGGGEASVKVGDKAPDISAKGTDGKTHTLKSLTEKGPVVLYFIKIGCPVNHRAAPHFDKISRAYKGKATMVGIINGNVADGKEWLERYKSDFLILEDPNIKTIRAYGAEYSPWAIAVEDGKVAKIMEGGSPTELTQINGFMAKAAKVPEAKLAWTGAPAGGG